MSIKLTKGNCPTCDKPKTECECTDVYDSIRIGDEVRSLDFPGIRDDCYVEGVVVAKGWFPDFPDCKRYKIQGHTQVIEGRAKATDKVVYPPLNGTPKLFGGLCKGVTKIN